MKNSKKFAQDLYDVLHQAQLEKDKLKHPYVDTSHLFLGMLKKHNGIKKYFETNFEITYDNFLEAVKQIVGKGIDQDEKPGNLYTPLLKKMLMMDDADEYNIDTLVVLHNMIEHGEGIVVRLLLQHYHLDGEQFDQILEDIETNQISGCYAPKELDLDKQVNINYAYDMLAVKKDNKHLAHYRKLPTLLVDDSIWNIVKERVYSLDATTSLTLHLRASMSAENGSTNQTNAAVFLNKTYQDGFIVIFEYKNGILTSEHNSTIMEDDLSDLLEVFSDKYGMIVLKDENLMSIKETGLKMLNTEELHIQYQEEHQKQMKKYEDTMLNRETSGVFKKMSCLSNVNERVAKYKTIITGMDEEAEQLIKGLMKLRKPNVMLKGEPGVGKTALVEKLACMINEGKVPEILQDKVIYELSMGGAVAGTKYRGEFEEKINQIIKAAEENPNVILFIDEAHMIVGAGGAEGAVDASNIFKPALARGTIRMIGATTNDEYDKFIKPDGAFSRRFSVVEILEPLEHQVKNIMKGLVPKLENVYRVTITDKLIDDIYQKAKMKKGMFPDIALDEMEEWCVQQSYTDYQEEASSTEAKQNKKKEKVS